MCELALFGKFKEWSKILASVLKTCVYDVRSSKKIWAQLEVPLRSYSQNMFIGILLSDVIKCKTESLRASFLDILFDTFKTLKYLWWIHWCFSYDIGDKIQSSILQSRKMVAVASLIDMLPIEGPVLRQCHDTDTGVMTVSQHWDNTDIYSNKFYQYR